MYKQTRWAIVFVFCLINNCWASKAIVGGEYGVNEHSESPVVQKISVANRNIKAWREVEEKIRNGVVQIFAQIAELDWLQPYRTPAQYSVRGSGFFIRDDGLIITNAHVVEEAVGVWIQMPPLGKRTIQVHICCIYPEHDIAFLKVDDDDLQYIKDMLGYIPILTCGDSNAMCATDEVLALGYPLGQEYIKTTNGIISGRQTIEGSNLIQTDTPINPGSSGGPLVNQDGEVIGINTCHVPDSQNANYAVPINDCKKVLPMIGTSKLLKRPFWGLITVKENDELTKFVGNPIPGGCYVAEVVHNGLLDRAGIKAGDMIYEVNGHRLDVYGEMQVPWSKDKVFIGDYFASLGIDETVQMVTYRAGQRNEYAIHAIHHDACPIRYIYPWYENVDYEVFAGMVVMPLTMDHIKILRDRAPGLMRYTVPNYQREPILVITHIFPNSLLARTRALSIGFTINEINGVSVKTLDDFRIALKKSTETKHIIIKASDRVGCLCDNIPVVLPFKKACQEIAELASMYHFSLSDEIQELIKDAT